MKGIETHMLLGLIFLVIIVLIIMIIAINPAILFSHGTSTQINFRQFCIHWSLSDYQDTSVFMSGETYPVDETCQEVLGVDPAMWDPTADTERCRNMCRAKV